jgi:formyltetrahydrofolate deformylase
MNDNTAIILMHCPDRPGLVAGLTELINANGGNILHLDQWVDNGENIFFMRIEWDLTGFAIPREEIDEWFGERFGRPFGVHHTLHFSDRKPRLAIFVSKMPHCLYDMLARHAAGEWRVEIPLVVSNHPDLQPVAERFGIEFRHFPISPENKMRQEEAELALLREYAIDTVVLARYMQVLSDDFIRRYPHAIINIHHSFLPAFMGAKPYHAAHARGVKLIGATSHFVTAELDQGPIIEQDVVHITHKDTVERLVRKGQDLEKIVLSRGVAKLIDHKVLAYKNRTVVFD